MWFKVTEDIFQQEQNKATKRRNWRYCKAFIRFHVSQLWLWYHPVLHWANLLLYLMWHFVKFVNPSNKRKADWRRNFLDEHNVANKSQTQTYSTSTALTGITRLVVLLTMARATTVRSAKFIEATRLYNFVRTSIRTASKSLYTENKLNQQLIQWATRLLNQSIRRGLLWLFHIYEIHHTQKMSLRNLLELIAHINLKNSIKRSSIHHIDSVLLFQTPYRQKT